MSVLVLAEDSLQRTTCVICLQTVPMSDVTAGSKYADGHQAFACSVHLHDRTRWITEWAVFENHQQQQKEIAQLAENII